MDDWTDADGGPELIPHPRLDYTARTTTPAIVSTSAPLRRGFFRAAESHPHALWVAARCALKRAFVSQSRTANRKSL
jgi:hypothetical protein